MSWSGNSLPLEVYPRRTGRAWPVLCWLPLLMCLGNGSQVLAQEDRRGEFICQVADLIQRGANFPDKPLFIQQDTLGYLWFFSDVSAYRFDGSRHKKIPFSVFFEEKGQFEFLRSVLRMPDGCFGFHFGDGRSGIPARDTLIVFDPILMQQVPHTVEDWLKPNEILWTSWEDEMGEGVSYWFLKDTLTNMQRVARPCGLSDSLKTVYEADVGFSIAPLFSSNATGQFFLLTSQDDPDQVKTVHCSHLGCTERRDNFAYTRGMNPLRSHQNHNLWFDSSGVFLTAVYRHESRPPYDQDLFWIHRQDGELLPDTTAGEWPCVDWSAFLNLKHGFRGSEVRFNPASQRLWVFIGNQLRIYSRAGELLAEVDLPAKDTFTMGLHSLQFISENEAVVVSAFGIMHIRIDDNPFEYARSRPTGKGSNLGCRAMVSWNQDTVLMMSDATGLYAISAGEITSVFPEAGRCSGLLVEGNDLMLTHQDALVRMKDLHPESLVQIAPLEAKLSWALNRDRQGRLLIGHEGWSALDSRGEVQFFDREISNAYAALITDSLSIIPTNAGLWVFTGHELRRADEMFPELSAIQSPCHAIMQASDGVVWISTKGQGLGRWVPEFGDVHWYGWNEGLPSQVIYGALEDDAGRIWASSNQGLIKIDPEGATVQVFGTKDGLVEAEFNRTSFLRHTDGRLYFGAIAGVTSFDPNLPAFDAESNDGVRLVIDRIVQHKRALNGVIDVTNQFRRHQQIDLGTNDDFVSIHPKVLDYGGLQHDFAYRVRSFQASTAQLPEWTMLDEEGVVLSNLDAGMWLVEIRAKSNEGGWLPEPLQVPIKVRIPWYMRGRNQAIAVVLLFGISMGLYQIRLRKLRKGNELLERKVTHRTEKLQEAIALKDVYLAETHHRVKNNLQIISSLLDLQAAQMKDEQIRAEFNISKIRIETINLIHQRLFNRQDVQSIDFKEFLVELFRLIERSQVDSERDLLLEITGDELDVRQREGIPLGMIFNEFITNTIKHVVPKQPVTRVSISIERRTDNQVLLIYDDFGPGLPDGIPFEKMESLGLRLVGGFVRQLKGSVTIDSKVSSRVLISFRLTE